MPAQVTPMLAGLPELADQASASREQPLLSMDDVREPAAAAHIGLVRDIEKSANRGRDIRCRDWGLDRCSSLFPRIVDQHDAFWNMVAGGAGFVLDFQIG